VLVMATTPPQEGLNAMGRELGDLGGRLDGLGGSVEAVRGQQDRQAEALAALEQQVRRGVCVTRARAGPWRGRVCDTCACRAVAWACFVGVAGWGG
jgi:hypothetical protein